MITQNIKRAYESVANEPIPEALMQLLRQLGDEKDNNNDDEPDSGIAAEPPPRPKGGPQSSGAKAPVQRSDHDA